jgi:hypothetical protein
MTYLATLQFVKQIGPGWQSENPGWMSFVSLSPVDSGQHQN